MDQSFFEGKTIMDVLSHFELWPGDETASVMSYLAGQTEVKLFAVCVSDDCEYEWVYADPVVATITGFDDLRKELRFLVRYTDGDFVPGLRMLGDITLKYEPTVYQDGHIVCQKQNGKGWHYNTGERFKDLSKWTLREHSVLAA